MGSPDGVVFEMLDCWDEPGVRALAATVATLTPGQFVGTPGGPGGVRVSNDGDQEWLIEVLGPQPNGEGVRLLSGRDFDPPDGGVARWHTRFDWLDVWLVAEAVAWVLTEVLGEPDLGVLARTVGGNVVPGGPVPCLHYLHAHLAPDDGGAGAGFAEHL